MNLKRFLTISIAAILSVATACSSEPKPLKALIVDGQNNHGVWPKSTVMMKQYLEETGLFTVDVARTQFTWRGDDLIEQFPIEGLPKTEALKEPKADPDFKPDFAQYDVVVSNFGFKAAPWPQETQDSFEAYVRNGGGFVSVHAANNSFGEWDAYNKMIAIGGWGGRTVEHGNYLYYDALQKLVRDPSDGKSGAHGPQHEYTITIRDGDHPITRGLPEKWLHTKDELYDRLRGPTENVTVLATAFSSTEFRGTGRHEPKLLTIDYGQGRVFHTTLGHADYSQECVGFITTFCRGVEWAATGAVTQAVPDDFPTEASLSLREFKRVNP